MIDAALELGRGLGFVPARPGGFMEELESIMARYTTGFFKFAIQVRIITRAHGIIRLKFLQRCKTLTTTAKP
eukprot:22054-Eustigmatos_ZCMA.PRE.1